MKITTVRHGQTSWNIERRLQGQSDIELDDMGLSQTEKLGLRLANEKIDIIYTSSLKRAAKTAEVINRHHGVELIVVPALREMHCGIYEGRILDGHEGFGQKLDYHYQNINEPMPEGESIAEISKRVRGFLDEVLAKQHKHVVIVSHYGIILNALCYFLQVPFEERRRFTIGNTAVHCFQREYDGTFDMIVENDTTHLDCRASSHQTMNRNLK